MTHILVLLTVSILVTNSRDLIAGGTNTIVLDTLYPKYTLKEGKMAHACIMLLGFESVESFQREHSLAPDGVVGPRTWRELLGALRQRGAHIELADTPIAISMTSAQDGHVCFEIYNRTTNNIFLEGGKSVGRKGPPQQLNIPISMKFSRQSGNRWSSGSDTSSLTVDLPAHIPPKSSIKFIKTYRPVGKGATQVFLSIVATEDKRRIFLFETEPLHLSDDARFVEN